MSSALLIVDMQNAFCSPAGSFAKRGVQIEGIDRVIDGCLRLRAHAEAAGWLVVHTCLTFRPDYADAGLLVADNPAIPQLGGYVEGTDDAGIVAALLPLPAGSQVLRKTRYDPFCGTPLEELLRQRRVDDVVVCGVATNVCVESTARRAYDLDFPVRIATDAVSSYDRALHEASLQTLSRHFATLVSVADLTAGNP